VSTGRPLTGRRVFAIAAVCFALVLAPNLVMAWFAVSTFSGLVVDNSYVASQGFDRDRTAQETLGWTFRVESGEDGILRLGFVDAEGQAVHPETLEVVVGRPTTARADLRLDLQRAPGGYVAAADLAPGNWIVMVAASAPDGTAYRRREPLIVPERP
jgi:nitrogen fixation protein FixH